MTTYKKIVMWMLLTSCGTSICLGASKKYIAGPAEDSILLQQTLVKFLQSADSGKIETVIALYDTGFTSIRVVDEGPLIKMDRQQMIYFWKMIAGRKAAGTGGINYQAITVSKTTINFTEIMGDMAYILLTRIKDLGHGPEPMFYNLIWKKNGSHWLLFREIVHQRTVPKMS